MKKAIIGVAIAAAIGAGIALNKDKIGDVAETQMTEFIETNLNKPIVVKRLQAHPAITTATITIKEKTENTIRSEFTIATADGDTITIPLNSEIVRGSVDYNDKSFGFGKITTKPDLSGLKGIPPFITNDTFSLEQYIDLMGNVTELYHIKPIKATEGSESLDFKGIEVTLDTQLFDRSAFDATVVFNGLDFNARKSTIKASEFSYNVALDSEGQYSGSSTPFSLALTKYNDTTTVKISKGDYTGTYKSIEGLTMPISNLDSTFDSISIITDKTTVTVDNMKIIGGTYEVADINGIDAKLDISGAFGPEGLPKTLSNGRPMPASFESFSLSYGFNNISHETANIYYDFANNFNFNSVDYDVNLTKLSQSLQKSNANLTMSATLKAAEGNSEASSSFALNEQGKALDPAELAKAFDSGNELWKFTNGYLLVTMDQGLADATDLTMAAQMFLQIQPKDEKLTLDIKLEDGKATKNGEPLAL